MFERKKILSFIGARSGSKGIKNKNIIDFEGKPLMNWTIEASLKSKYIDHTIVSTDSEIIAKMARDDGADAPFLRPPEISGDSAKYLDAISHCIDWMKKNLNYVFDLIIALQPIAPLRTEKHIDQAVEYYFNKRRSEVDTLASVIQLPKKFGWVFKGSNTGYMDYCFDMGRLNLQRQEMENYYMPNGAIFLGPVETVIQSGFYSEQTLFYKMSDKDSVDIDTREDLDKALKIFRARLKHK